MTRSGRGGSNERATHSVPPLDASSQLSLLLFTPSPLCLIMPRSRRHRVTSKHIKGKVYARGISRRFRPDAVLWGASPSKKAYSKVSFASWTWSNEMMMTDVCAISSRRAHQASSPPPAVSTQKTIELPTPQPDQPQAGPSTGNSPRLASQRIPLWLSSTLMHKGVLSSPLMLVTLPRRKKQGRFNKKKKQCASSASSLTRSSWKRALHRSRSARRPQRSSLQALNPS